MSSDLAKNQINITHSIPL